LPPNEGPGFIRDPRRICDRFCHQAFEQAGGTITARPEVKDFDLSAGANLWP